MDFSEGSEGLSPETFNEGCDMLDLGHPILSIRDPFSVKDGYVAKSGLLVKECSGSKELGLNSLTMAMGGTVDQPRGGGFQSELAQSVLRQAETLGDADGVV